MTKIRKNEFGAYISIDGEDYYETESRFKDTKTGTALRTFYRYNDENDLIYMILNLDGSVEME